MSLWLFGETEPWAAEVLGNDEQAVVLREKIVFVFGVSEYICAVTVVTGQNIGIPLDLGLREEGDGHLANTHPRRKEAI